ncbi:hypothetical protein JJE63_01105 [Alloprevotella tannerae]|jgi:hypothetical protein|uniref:hypothetical protein n=1 Tax=Alloprevotella tannerae TaxID=76122 RepID=UPI001EDC8B77|nr:hypothetical protein [Alloprevotella tannerae]MCG2651934.1 hypothetical protein [Alloprevotella tannerae]DAN56275.1 MAG TPA: hypothetical protein [Caudoviricetes sp.]
MGKKTEEKEGKVTIKVTEDFLDKFDNTVRYDVGNVLEFDAARAEDVVNRGLAEYVEPELPQG